MTTWEEEHGYEEYKCWICGRVFWTDGTPECCEEEGVCPQKNRLLFGGNQEDEYRMSYSTPSWDAVKRGFSNHEEEE